MRPWVTLLDLEGFNPSWTLSDRNAWVVVWFFPAHTNRLSLVFALAGNHVELAMVNIGLVVAGVVPGELSGAGNSFGNWNLARIVAGLCDPICAVDDIWLARVAIRVSEIF